MRCLSDDIADLSNFDFFLGGGRCGVCIEHPFKSTHFPSNEAFTFFITPLDISPANVDLPTLLTVPPNTIRVFSDGWKSAEGRRHPTILAQCHGHIFVYFFLQCTLLIPSVIFEVEAGAIKGSVNEVAPLVKFRIDGFLFVLMPDLLFSQCCP